MKMLLRHLSFVDLATLLKKHEGRSPAPHLIDPEAKRRARRIARKSRLWKQIERDLDPSRDIPVIKRSVFRQFQRNGNRLPHQVAEKARSHELEQAALALWLDHPKADLDYLHDILWAYCDDWTWVMAAHEYAAVDLGAAARGARLAEILHALEDRIEPEVADRVHGEIERRLFRQVANYENTEFWHTARMNWNHVCNGGIVRAALLEIKDSRVLARLIHPLIQNMTYALDGFTEDGGCEEGASYWGFGFGHFVQAAYALHCRTAGELNIMEHEKVERICRFPLAAHMDGSFRACFGDCGPGCVAALNALQINHFFRIPELYELCARRDTGETKGAGPLQVEDMHSIALYRDERATGKADTRDYVLPKLGMATMRGEMGPDRMTVAAVAGHNGVAHSHNDIGSFMVHVRGRMVITDPGGPQYNRQTFSDRRYEILYCRSRGHSVPIINGREQKAGERHRGELTTEGLNESRSKRIIIDMSRAYPRGTVQRLTRTLILTAVSNVLTIEDAYQFREEPTTLEEAFVTFEKAVVTKKGNAVRIGPVRGGATLSADRAGRFEVETLKEKPEHTKPGVPPLQRIRFVPDTLSRELIIRFTLR